MSYAERVKAEFRKSNEERSKAIADREAIADRKASGVLSKASSAYVRTVWTGPAGAVKYRREPRTANQHILYLLLTVFTAGLFLPVWIILAIQGNSVPVEPAEPVAPVETGGQDAAFWRAVEQTARENVAAAERAAAEAEAAGQDGAGAA